MKSDPQSVKGKTYRQKACRCLEQAERMASGEAKTILADLAAHWFRLAEQAERIEASQSSDTPPYTVLLVLPGEPPPPKNA